MKRYLLILLSIVFCAEFAFAQVSFDLQVLDAGPFQYLTPGTYPVYITAKNLNQDYAVVSLQAHWQLDGGDVHDCAINQFMIFSNSIYPGFLERFTHDDSMTISSTGIYNLKVWTSMPNNSADPNPSNDTAFLTIHAVDSLPERKVVMFYGTHTDCFPCGTYGEPEFNEVIDSFPENVYTISAHDVTAGDPYENDDAEHLNNVYIWPYTGHPAFIFDFFKFPYYYDINPDNNYVFGNIWKSVPLRMDYRYPVKVTVEKLVLDTMSKILSGEVHAEFYSDFSSDLAVNAIIAEDSIYGPQDGVPGGYIYHRYVLRDMTDGLYGSTSVIPSEVSAGDEFIYNFSVELNADIDVHNIYVLGYVQHASDDSMACDILNSDMERVTENSIATSVSVVGSDQNQIEIFPNPASDIATIRFPSIVHGDARVEIFDVTGMKVKELFPLSISNHFARMSLSDLPHGMYFLKASYQGKQMRTPLVKESSGDE